MTRVGGSINKEGNQAAGGLPDVLRVRLKSQEEQLRRLSAKLDEQLQYRARLNRELSAQRRELAAANQKIAELQSSVSFRLGSLVVGTARSPRRIFSIPAELLKLCRELMPRVWRRLIRRGHSPEDAPDLGPEFADADLPPAGDAREGASIARLMHGTENAPELPEDTSGIRIATIMDEFSFAAFRHCGDLRQIVAGEWREQMELFAPHMLLVESAWKGKGESWARKVYPLSKDLVELVAWCRERRIPTVFWNKEDPVHLSVFMRTARQFDFVFTTDIDCVRAYKAALGHDQVYWLPFACQPAEHNPVEEFRREDRFCFAGSYYAKYPERQRDFAAIVQAVQAFRPVDIYDRNAGSADPMLVFPGEYAAMIQGSLPHDQISVAYKGYRFGININTVKQSQSMFARRAFDLLASNTVTVSNFSRGMRMLLGDLVVSSDDAHQLGDRVRPLVEDERRYRKFRLAGLRKVMSEHTYQHRLRYVLEKVGGRKVPDDRARIVAVGRAASKAEAESILAAFRRQSWPRKELFLVLDGADPPGGVLDDVTMVGPELRVEDLVEEREDCWFALLDPRDHYGNNYLVDLALATRYTDATAIGKAAHYGWTPEGVVLHAGDRAYVPGNSIPWRRAMVHASAVPTDVPPDAMQDAADATLPNAFAIDEFNYCADGHERAVDGAVGDLGDLWTGLRLDQLQHLAERATAADDPGSRQLASPELDAHSLASILPVGAHADGQVQLAEGVGGLRLTSTLDNEKHVYLYTKSPVPVDRLFDGAIGKFNFVVETEMLVSLVFVYLDAAGKRLGHAIRACSSNLNMSPPAGTARVRMGLRVQGPGQALVRRLVLGHVPSPVAGIPAAGRHLVISRGYPAYDNLYSYAYVHRRIIGYAESGLPVDVFRVTEGDLAFSEFEGVDVVSGPLADLEMMVQTNEYGSLVVHSLDRALWSVLSEHAGGQQVLVWIHGAEIQPWYRRDFSFIDDRDRERGIQRSNDRMAFWRDLFGNPPANVKFVFVSRHLAREAFRDVGIELDPSRYVVIHNHIDGELFEYRPKQAEQRLRILSIRPYSRPTYANDLAVRAILDLADEPWFPEMEFRLVGDGRLFEDTVAPLRDFKNVILEQRFLTQQEIAGLHGTHGVFLVPSRIDSQGVSRDEAMASGLVPVTNRVSAVPEFVDENSAFLAGPEDWKGLADAIRRIYAEPGTFLAMSEEAARRVRAQSGREQTLEREVALLQGEPETAGSLGAPLSRRRPRIALYGDLDLNLIDGSAIWAVSLAQAVAGGDLVDVDLYLKAPIRKTQVIRPLLGLVNVRLVEPPQAVQRRTPAEALDAIIAADQARAYDAVVLRGLDLASQAVERSALKGRLWVYLTDVPQRSIEFTADIRQALSAVAGGSTLLLCQTTELADHLERMIPEAAGKTRLLPPMVPDLPPDRVRMPGEGGGPLKLAYAGKFAPLWGIRELFEAFDLLRAEGVAIELHVFGDKVHNPLDDHRFRDETIARLEAGNGLVWYRGLDRASVLEHLATMDAGWAWRLPELEEGTLELSTKLLEYAQCGTPPVVARGPVNVSLLGDDYPLFVDRAGIVQLLRELAREPGRLRPVQETLGRIANDYAFTRIREHHFMPLLASPVARGDAPPGQGEVAP